MMTTLQLLAENTNIPTTTAWYLADLGEARGKQELFTKQSPQRLKVLREHALIESAVSSNRIEGVTVEQSRVKAVVLGKSLLRIAMNRRSADIAMPPNLFMSKAQNFPSLRKRYCG